MKKMYLLAAIISIGSAFLLSGCGEQANAEELLTERQLIKKYDIANKVVRECGHLKAEAPFRQCTKKIYIREGGY